MADHLFDELDRDEIDLFGDDDGLSIREKLRTWLGYAPSPFQTDVAEQKVEQMRSTAEAFGFRVETHPLREGQRLVERTVLRDARGRFVARGARRVSTFLEEDIAF